MHKTYKCEICNKILTYITPHIINDHQLNPQEYYDTYILKNRSDKLCPVCGKTNTFVGITYGYRKHCSVSCSSLDKNVQNKARETCIKLYGVEHNWNKGILRNKVEDTMKKKYGVKHNWQRGPLRAKENFKISKLEQYFKDNAKQLKIEYEFQHYDEKYPYMCDFYLPKFDIYVEINGSALHNYHIYDETNSEDVEELNIISKKAETSSWYSSLKRVWLSDSEKVKTANKNNIKLEILWNKDDIIHFLNSLSKRR